VPKLSLNEIAPLMNAAFAAAVCSAKAIPVRLVMPSLVFCLTD
jgi:hypothetical protein